MVLDPLKRSRQRQAPSLAFHTIGVQGYFGSVQPPSFRNSWIRPCKFYQNLNQTLRRFSDKNLIIGGDFNCALTPKDRKSVKQGPIKHTVINEIGNLCSNFALTDIWREINPQALSFTWHDKAFKSQSRLDFFLITADLVYLTKESNIMHTPFSDHSAIMLNIQSLDQRKKIRPRFLEI